ncbi:MAG: nitrilase-related carbon-nitrogen hydrolase [Bacteroidota bacterium]
MKICIAQSRSAKGKIKENISAHLKLINRATKLNADLIIFPELSLTAYEPALAKSLAVETQSKTFNLSTSSNFNSSGAPYLVQIIAFIN